MQCKHAQKKYGKPGRRANALYTAWAADNGVNSYRLLVLYAIDGNNAVTQKMISECTGLSKQTVNTVVRALKMEGYLELTGGNSDRREKTVILTPEGEKYSSDILGRLHSLENGVFDIIGTERINEMINAIELFTTVFAKGTRNKSGEN